MRGRGQVTRKDVWLRVAKRGVTEGISAGTGSHQWVPPQGHFEAPWDGDTMGLEHLEDTLVTPRDGALMGWGWGHPGDTMGQGHHGDTMEWDAYGMGTPWGHRRTGHPRDGDTAGQGHPGDTTKTT